jgi:hypothetical protein
MEEEIIESVLENMKEKEFTAEEKKENALKIKKETNRLKKLYKDLDKNKKQLVLKLIENAAFMSITLENLKEEIKNNGVKEFYMNGKGQFGYKESVESKNYNVTIKNYMNVIKQLNDMLPEQKQINEDDEFDKFNGAL